MRSIACALISFVCWYMATHTSKDKTPLIALTVILAYCMLLTAFVMMIIGM